MKKIAVLAALGAAMISTAAAAQDGPLSDTTSSASLDLSATIVPMVSIRGLDDMTFTINTAAINNPSSWAAIGNSTFCVFSNADVNGSYKIKAEGSGAGSAFLLNGGATGSSLPYIVHLKDTATTSPNGNMAAPAVYKNFTNTAGGQLRATDLNCSNAGGANAGVSVRIGDTAALAALADTYTGTLTVTVSVP